MDEHVGVKDVEKLPARMLPYASRSVPNLLTVDFARKRTNIAGFWHVAVLSDRCVSSLSSKQLVPIPIPEPYLDKVSWPQPHF